MEAHRAAWVQSLATAHPATATTTPTATWMATLPTAVVTMVVPGPAAADTTFVVTVNTSVNPAMTTTAAIILIMTAAATR